MSTVVFDNKLESSCFFIVNGNQVEYWSCDKETMEYSFATEDKNAVCIDPVTNNLITYKEQCLYFYDIETKQKVRKVGYYKYYKNSQGGKVPKKFVVIDDVIYVDNKKLDLKQYEKIN